MTHKSSELDKKKLAIIVGIAIVACILISGVIVLISTLNKGSDNNKTNVVDSNTPSIVGSQVDEPEKPNTGARDYVDPKTGIMVHRPWSEIAATKRSEAYLSKSFGIVVTKVWDITQTDGMYGFFLHPGYKNTNLSVDVVSGKYVIPFTLTFNPNSAGIGRDTSLKVGYEFTPSRDRSIKIYQVIMHDPARVGEVVEITNSAPNYGMMKGSPASGNEEYDNIYGFITLDKTIIDNSISDSLYTLSPVMGGGAQKVSVSISSGKLVVE